MRRDATARGTSIVYEQVSENSGSVVRTPTTAEQDNLTVTIVSTDDTRSRACVHCTASTTGHKLLVTLSHSYIAVRQQPQCMCSHSSPAGRTCQSCYAMPPQSQFQTQVANSLTVVVHWVARVASPLAPRSVATGIPGEHTLTPLFTSTHPSLSPVLAKLLITLCVTGFELCRRTAIRVHKYSSSVRLFTQPVSYCQLTALAAEATPRAGTSYNEKSPT